MSHSEPTSAFQLVLALHHYGFWTNKQLLEWIYEQLANEPDNLLWSNLVFYWPKIYLSLYPEKSPPLIQLSANQFFYLHLVNVDLSSQSSIDQFNDVLMTRFYTFEDDDMNASMRSYYYHLDDRLESLDKRDIDSWVIDQLSNMLSQAQAEVAKLLMPLQINNQ